MSRTREDVALATREAESSEIAATAGAARVQQEIQAGVVLAHRFPRNADQAFAEIVTSCRRPSFADGAEYKFPRGNKFNEESGKWEKNYVTGATVDLMREAARCWGNIRYGFAVIRDTQQMRGLLGYAWDLERNIFASYEDEFQKLVQRRVNVGTEADKRFETQWVQPDERDLRELTNRRGAILERNALEHVLPSDIIDDALSVARETKLSKVAKDPNGERKKVIIAFQSINISPKMLEEKLGHSLDQCSPTQVVELREIYASIRGGHTVWGDWLGEDRMKDKAKGKADISDLVGGAAAAPSTTAAGATTDEKKSEPTQQRRSAAAAKPDTVVTAGTEANRGHGGDGLDALVTKEPPPAKSTTGAKLSDSHKKLQDKFLAADNPLEAFKAASSLLFGVGYSSVAEISESEATWMLDEINKSALVITPEGVRRA